MRRINKSQASLTVHVQYKRCSSAPGASHPSVDNDEGKCGGIFVAEEVMVAEDVIRQANEPAKYMAAIRMSADSQFKSITVIFECFGDTIRTNPTNGYESVAELPSNVSKECLARFPPACRSVEWSLSSPRWDI